MNKDNSITNGNSITNDESSITNTKIDNSQFVIHNSKVPKFRFKEFVGDGEWKEDILGKVAEFSKGKGVSKKNITSDGTLYCIRYGELYTQYNEVIDEVISKTNLPKNDLVLSKKNDIIIPSSGETQIDIARASCVLREGIALGGDLNIVRSKINGVFLSYYLNSSKKRAIAQMAQGVSVMHLYNSQIEKLEIEIPTNPKEQQKIANTLSSLDDYIKAETEKLSLLKDHKKGLLQQLFPAKGETVPKKRFPEFVKDGEWEEIEIRELGETISGLRGKKGSDFGSGKPYVTYKQVFDCSFVKFEECSRVKIAIEENQNTLQKGDILFTTSSETPNEVGFASVIIKEPKEPTYLNSFCFVLRPNNLEKLLPNFSRFLFHSRIYRDKVVLIAQGSTRFNLSKGAFIKLKILLPINPQEQQKIADTLTAIDELIQAQTIKISNLQTHKKGLMQGLFPNTNNVAL